MRGRPVVLMILDGWGSAPDSPGNAVTKAKLPVFHRLLKEYPSTELAAHGEAIGLPSGTLGGSEPGHLTMGAGRVVWQPLAAIDHAIEDGSFSINSALLKAITDCKSKGSTLHLLGLFSDAAVHATTKHLYALLKLAKDHGLKEVFVHAFLDGRDVPEKSAEKYLREFEEQSIAIGIGSIASVVGRYYAMDRDNNWDRIQKAYELLVDGKGHQYPDAYAAIQAAYARGDRSDYYVEPSVIIKDDQPLATIKNGDTVIFYNFRADRGRELTAALTQKSFTHFKRSSVPNISFVGLGEYDPALQNVPAAFPPQKVMHNFGQVIADAGLRQLRIAETEKYAHVTYFFNSQVEQENPGEVRILIDSLKVPAYDSAPQMSAAEITKRVISEIRADTFDVIILNFANADLVGHSGNLEATIQALQVLDHCIGEVVTVVEERGGEVVIVGDHGNAEQMIYPDSGEVCPAHTTNPVPCIVVSERFKNRQLKAGSRLQDVAPTLLFLLGIEKPTEMTGESLLK